MGNTDMSHSKPKDTTTERAYAACGADLRSFIPVGKKKKKKQQLEPSQHGSKKKGRAKGKGGCGLERGQWKRSPSI